MQWEAGGGAAGDCLPAAVILEDGKSSDSSREQCRDRDMLIEELQTSPRGEEEAGGTYENGAGGGEEGAGGLDQSLEGGAGGENDGGDSVSSLEPPTSIIVTNLTLETFEQPEERVSYWT